jgi:hypothetical protein
LGAAAVSALTLGTVAALRGVATADDDPEAPGADLLLETLDLSGREVPRVAPVMSGVWWRRCRSWRCCESR